MKPNIRVATIGAAAVVIAAVIAALAQRSKPTSSSTPETVQTSHGEKSPNINTKEAVTINYGASDSAPVATYTAALLLSKPSNSIPYGYLATGTDDKGVIRHSLAEPRSRIQGQPNEHSQDLVVEFQVTNPNTIEHRIKKVLVEVRSFTPLSNVKAEPVASGGQVRKYFCDISAKAGFYEAKPIKGDFDFVKLARAELEVFGLNINTKDPGLYELSVWIEVAWGTEEKRLKVGDVDESIVFL